MRQEPGDPHVLAPGQAPTPFTADEIRAGCPDGRTIRLQVDLAGEPPLLRMSRFYDGDESGTTLERSALSADGSPLGEPEPGRVTWRELQEHASFPADATSVAPERIETAIGELDCLRYTVLDGSTEQVLWFADDLPGMPVRYLTRVDGQVVATASVVDNAVR